MIHIIDIDIESKVVGLFAVQFLTTRLSKFSIGMHCVIGNYAPGNWEQECCYECMQAVI